MPVCYPREDQEVGGSQGAFMHAFGTEVFVFVTGWLKPEHLSR